MSHAVVRFSVQYHTYVGEGIYICGGPLELGKWNPALAVPLAWMGSDTWAAHVLVPRATTFEYKYFCRSGNNPPKWESGLNHMRTVPHDYEVAEIHDTWHAPLSFGDDVASTAAVRAVEGGNRNPLVSSPAPTAGEVVVQCEASIPYLDASYEPVLVGETKERQFWSGANGISLSCIDGKSLFGCQMTVCLPFDLAKNVLFGSYISSASRRCHWYTRSLSPFSPPDFIMRQFALRTSSGQTIFEQGANRIVDAPLSLGFREPSSESTAAPPESVGLMHLYC